MKKIFTLSVLFFSIAFTVLAAPPSGKLTVYSHHATSIRILIDGKRYPLEYNMLVLNDLPPGNHTIKIVERATGGVLSSREKVLYNGSVYIRTNYHVDIVVNRFGKILIDKQDVRNDPSYEDDDFGYDNAMSDASFDLLKKALQQEKFTSGRMSVAKTAISSNYFKTEQVRQIAQSFSFEDDKMQIVKAAYPRTIDRSNYYLLSSLFSFSSNKEELSRFIRENSTQNNSDYSVKPIIGDEEFSKLKARMQTSYSENARLTTAKQAIDLHYFTAEQVKELVLLFGFDAGRLDIAKYAYGKTTNRADYLLYLNDVFASRTSKDELARYIANYR